MNTPMHFKQKLRLIVANLSWRERIVFIMSLAILATGVIGGLVLLSYQFTTVVPLRGGNYREGIIGSPRFINPVLATSDADHDLSSLIYSGLARVNEEGAPIPDLAESWTISEDGLSYTVTLKNGLVFHDKKPLTASDVVFTVSAIQNPELKSPLRVAWEGVSASAPDAKTVVFTLQKPYSGFLSQLTLGILPEHIWKPIPTEEWQTSQYNTEPVGSGAYSLSDVSRSRIGVPEQYSLKAFKHFALERPYITHVDIVSFANKADAYQAFDARIIDGLSTVDSSDVDTVRTNRTNVLKEPLPRVFGIFFNPAKNKIFAESAVIQALNLGIDKQAMIDAIFRGYASPLSGPLPQSIDTSDSDYATRLDLAKKILDGAGWKMNEETGIRAKAISSASKGTVMQPLTFSIATANTPELEQASQIIADQFKELGADVEIKVFEIGTLNQNIIRGRDFDALLFGQVIKHDTDIFAFWHSSQKLDPGLNITGYTNKSVDTLLESAIKEADQEKRGEIYGKIAAQLAKDAPVIFLYTPDFVSLINPHVYNAVVPPIAGGESRFALIYKWYMRTDHVWNAFVK